MLELSDTEWAELPDAEKNRRIKAEVYGVIHACEMIAAGLAVRYAGLIYFLPLCHDAYGENI